MSEYGNEVQKKTFGEKLLSIIFALPKKTNGPLVKGLRRLSFTEESRVRFSYGLQKKGILGGSLF